MSQQIRRYVAEKENFEWNRGFNEAEQTASNLRQQFLNKYILNFDTNLYVTQEQRDWAYIAKRQFNYDVRLTGFGYATMIGNAVLTWRIFLKKKMVWWPLLVPVVCYFAITPALFQKHSKKLFDMCNLGTDYYLGRKRQEVLQHCNQILDVEDF